MMLARMLNQKPPIGAIFLPRPKSARERAEERWFNRGNPSVSTTTASDETLPGQYFDEETGLHYNYFRYYDPTLGRYITSDPIGIGPSLNTYLYVGANPLRYYDSLGLFGEDFINIMGDIGSKGIGDWFKDLFVDQVMKGAIAKCKNILTCAAVRSPLFDENAIAACVDILEDLNVSAIAMGGAVGKCKGKCKEELEKECSEGDPVACKDLEPVPVG